MKLPSLLFAVLLLTACSDATEQDKNPSISELRGQWVVVNYWAKWCKPCIREIPELNALNREYAEVTVLGVNYDGAEGEELASQISELEVKFPMLTEDPAGKLGAPRPLVLPTTLIINPAGKLIQTLIGPQTLESLTAATEQSGTLPQESW